MQFAKDDDNNVDIVQKSKISKNNNKPVLDEPSLSERMRPRHLSDHNISWPQHPMPTTKGAARCEKHPR